MNIATEILLVVRKRANYACEYCGVSETDAGGELTVDHYRPRSVGGSDDDGNLVYCCQRCNLYKADYWPAQPTDPTLWNPRQELFARHLLNLADGTVHAITAVGEFTIRRLRLNRSPLVEHRLRKQTNEDSQRLLTRYRDSLGIIAALQTQVEDLLAENRQLLEQQRELLKMLTQESSPERSDQGD